MYLIIYFLSIYFIFSLIPIMGKQILLIVLYISGYTLKLRFNRLNRESFSPLLEKSIFWYSHLRWQWPLCWFGRFTPQNPFLYSYWVICHSLHITVICFFFFVKVSSLVLKHFLYDQIGDVLRHSRSSE